MNRFGHLGNRLRTSVFHDIRRLSKIFAAWSLSLGFLVASPYAQGSEASENWLQTVQRQIVARFQVNDQAGARRIAESAVTTATKEFGADSEEAVVASALLARVLKGIGEHEQAITILGRVMSVTESRLVADHSSVAAVLW